jgi:hypothetical protein
LLRGIRRAFRQAPAQDLDTFLHDRGLAGWLRDSPQKHSLLSGSLRDLAIEILARRLGKKRWQIRQAITKRVPARRSHRK